jgi:hypothetical protein
VEDTPKYEEMAAIERMIFETEMNLPKSAETDIINTH